MTGHQLGVVKRGAARPRPTRVVHVVGLRRAQGVESTEPLERGQLLVDRDGNVVLRQQFADAALLTLGARAVVAEDVEHERVLGLGQSVQLVEDPADLNVDVLHEAGEDLHQPPLEGSLRFGDVVPALHGVGARRELGVVGDPAAFLLPGEDTLAIVVPAVVELPRVLVRPLTEDVVRAVRGAGRPVHQERAVGREGFVAAQPGDGRSARSSDRW